MKVLGFIVCCFIFFRARSQDTLQAARRLFATAGVKEDSASRLDVLLAPINRQSPPVLLCYKGAAKMVLAKYIYNPLKKYRSFVNGRAFIEAAIGRDTGNIEMRFLRFAIQTRLPSFLGYSMDINSDKEFIALHFRLAADTAVRQLIVHYFESSGILSERAKMLGHE